jgi:aminoglycoside phosphotransferase (APT) family kinase protein
MIHERMKALAPKEARWIRPQPRRTLPAAGLDRMIRAAFPCSSIVEVQPLTDGLRNSNFKVRLHSSAEPVVLRIYEHDRSLCKKEIDLIRLVNSSIPAPELIHAEPDGLDEIPPFAFFGYVEGLTFQELKKRGDRDAIGQAAYAVGHTLAAIGRINFSKPGWLAPGPSVRAHSWEGADATVRFVECCLESTNLRHRMDICLRQRVHAFISWWAHDLGPLDRETRLVHGDFGNRNLIVRNIAGNWSVAAVLDWEFAGSGSPVADLGHFLRYEHALRPLREPHFSRGYLDGGGMLPQNWRDLSRVVDLTALLESLAHQELPDSVTRELVGLVRATVDNREPRLA